MPVGNLPGWRRVFADDFTTNVNVGHFSGCDAVARLMSRTCAGLPRSVAARWWAYPDGWSDTVGNGVYAPSRTVSISDGVLDIRLRSLPYGNLVAALVPKVPGGVRGGGLLYGRYVVRFRADEVPGFKTAFLLWPDSDMFPADGEIDFPEADLNSTIDAFMHYQGATINYAQDGFYTRARYGRWHTATIEWTPAYVSFKLDGRVVGRSVAHIPDTPMHWVLQTETSTYGVAPSPGAIANVQVDWAVAYSLCSECF
jgi:hypothetical protein